MTQPAPGKSYPVGVTGRVTGTIAPGEIGAVTLPSHGGTMAFNAFAYDGESIYPIGTLVSVVDYVAPITVYVMRIA